MKIGFYGMTHLGAVHAPVLASYGHEVVCIADGALAPFEPGLTELLDSVRGITFSKSPNALAGCDVIYIGRDVDTTKDLDEVVVMTSVALQVNLTAPVVVLSQTPPGWARKNISNPRVYLRLDTLIFGQAVQEAKHPSQIVIGCPSPMHPPPQAILSLMSSHKEVPIKITSYENVEMAKVALNALLAVQVTMTNDLAEIACTMDASWHIVRNILQDDRRIGKHAYLTPGLGINGGHLLRDVRVAATRGSDLAERVLTVNVYHTRWIKRILSTIPKTREPQRITIWGLAYKAGTDSTVNSPALSLIRWEGVKNRYRSVRPKFVVHDPVVFLDDPQVERVDDHMHATVSADVLVISTPWPQYYNADPQRLYWNMSERCHKLVLDPFACLDVNKVRDVGLDYRTLAHA